MHYLIFVAVLPAVLCQWDPNCGGSPYEDAGREQEDGKFIIGGWESRPHEFPWMVSIRNVGGSHWCGGSLITPAHVLTAAHCMSGETASDVEVVVGEHFRDTENDDKQVIGVETIFDHEDYRPSLIYNDISVLKLERDAVISENVGTVCAPVDADYDGLMATVSGWGSTGPGQAPNELRYTNLPTMTNADCRVCDIFGIAGGNICAGECGGTDRDTCQGDSGGPMAVKDESTGLWTVIGITSWGFGCAGDYPGVYTRVSFYNDWISDKINRA